MARLIQVDGRWLTCDEIRGTRQWQTLREKYIAWGDGRPCPRCHRTMRRGWPVRSLWPSADHVVPLEDGGAAFDPDNITVMCLGCNSAKSNRCTAPTELHCESW